MPQVKVSTILQLVRVLGARDMVVEVREGSTVGDLMRLLAQRADPGASRLLFADQEGDLQPSVSIMVNGRNLLFLRGLETVLHNDDQVTILPAGGVG